VWRGESAALASHIFYVAKTELYTTTSRRNVNYPQLHDADAMSCSGSNQLPRQKHTVRLKDSEPRRKEPVYLNEFIVTDNKPANTTHP